jgi:transposase-like protein
VPVPRHPTAEAVHRLVEDDRLGICEELRERFKAFKRRDLYDIQLAALFLDAICLPVRPDGPKEGALVAWGFTEHGERVLLSVMLGMRESHEDWLELGCDLIARGLGAPLLVVADGAPGLIRRSSSAGPPRDRQRCCVHRVRNLLASCPSGSASASPRPTGRRSTTPPTSATETETPNARQRARRCRLHRRELVLVGRSSTVEPCPIGGRRRSLR